MIFLLSSPFTQSLLAKAAPASYVSLLVVPGDRRWWSVRCETLSSIEIR